MKSSPIGEVHRKMPKSSAPAFAVSGKFGGKTQMLILLLVSSLVFFFGASFADTHDSPIGDEPHYLVISQTLLLYHSLDVTLDYTHGDYKTFFPDLLGPALHTSTNKWGQRLPLHSIGAPILWLLPFAIAGRLGTLFFMALVSVFIVANIYLLLLSLGIQRNYAFLASMGIALASPIWVFSHHNFVEPIAAFCCIYTIQVLFRKNVRTWDLLGSSIALGILPWLHIRFALFEVILFCFLLARVYQEYRFTQIKPYLFALLPLCILFFAFEAYDFFIWGSLNPAINQVDSGEVPFDNAPKRGLLGLFFDQEVGLLINFPLFLFLLGGIILALKKRFLRFNILLLLLVVPYVITIASFHNWDGAISPPARFLTVLVPPLAFFLALALQSARSKVVNSLFLLFIAVTMLYEGVSLSIPGGWVSHQGGRSQPLVLIGQALHLPLTSYAPSFFSAAHKPIFPLPAQLAPFLGWLILVGAITILVILLAWRQKRLILPSSS